jgi:hypothetical protein
MEHQIRKILPAMLLEGFFKKDQGIESDEDYEKSVNEAKERWKRKSS